MIVLSLTLDRYKFQFSNLHRAKIKGEKAPHKIILLLAIIDRAEEIMMHGDAGREVLLNAPLAFRPHLEYFFYKEWNLHVHSKVFKPSYENPLIHMEYELFYHLIPRIDNDTHSPVPFSGSHSVSALEKAFDGIKLENELSLLLTEQENRTLLRTFLIELL